MPASTYISRSSNIKRKSINNRTSKIYPVKHQLEQRLDVATLLICCFLEFMLTYLNYFGKVEFLEQIQKNLKSAACDVFQVG